MTNDMFGIDARRYAALAGLMHGGDLQPIPLGWAEAYRAVGARGQPETSHCGLD